MGCYFCKLLFPPPICVTYKTLFYFYYKWNQEKLHDPQFLSQILSLYAGRTEVLMYELEVKYGEFPLLYNDSIYMKYMQRRLFNVYAEHTVRLQKEGIDFVFELTKSFENNLDILLNKAVLRYGQDTTPISFPLTKIDKSDIDTAQLKKETVGQFELSTCDKNKINNLCDFNESTIDVVSSEEFTTDTSCEWDIVD